MPCRNLNGLRLSMRARAPQAARGRRGGGCLWHTHPNANSIWSVILPADGTRTATVGNGDFGTSPLFGQLSDKPLLASIWLRGVSERKAQWRIEKLLADLIR
jgi:hypothetical protein